MKSQLYACAQRIIALWAADTRSTFLSSLGIVAPAIGRMEGLTTSDP